MRPDTEKAIKEYGIKTFLNENNIKKAEEQLRSDETVLYISPTNVSIYTGNKKENIVGIIVITNQRVFVYSKVLFSVRVESFSMVDLNSIDSTSNGMTGSKIKLNTNTKSIEILLSYKSSVATKVMQIIEIAMNDAKSANKSNQIINNANKSDADELAKFAELRNKGIITDEEFEVKKKQILGL